MTATEQEETEQTTEQKSYLEILRINLQDEGTLVYGVLFGLYIIGSMLLLAYLSGIPTPCI